MTGDLLLLNGDAVTFSPMFGHRTVTPTAPSTIKASGFACVGGKQVCVAGDEKTLSLSASYTVLPSGTAPGTGTIAIHQLMLDHCAQTVRSPGGVLRKGSVFTARFTPTVQAMVMTPGGTPAPDLPAPTFGTGFFEPSQTFVHGD